MVGGSSQCCKRNKNKPLIYCTVTGSDVTAMLHISREYVFDMACYNVSCIETKRTERGSKEQHSDAVVTDNWRLMTSLLYYYYVTYLVVTLITSLLYCDVTFLVVTFMTSLLYNYDVSNLVTLMASQLYYDVTIQLLCRHLPGYFNEITTLL